jgi:O-antigen ligase
MAQLVAHVGSLNTDRCRVNLLPPHSFFGWSPRAHVHTVLTFLLSTLWRAYGLVVFSVFFSVADQPLGRTGVLPLSPTLSAVLVLVPFLIAATFRDLRSRTSIHLVRPIRDNLIPLLPFASIVFFSLMLSVLPDAFWEEEGKWIFLIAYGFAITLLAIFIPGVTSLRPAIPWCIISALSLLLWSLWQDLSVPGTYSAIGQRAAGFPGNANFAALVTVMLCAASLDFNRRGSGWRDLLIITLGILMVLGTMSRSGALNLTALIGVYLYYRLVHDGFRLQETIRLGTGLVATVTVLITAIPLFTSDLAGLQGSTRLTRLLNNQQIDDGSSETRLFAVTDSLRRINQSPVLGHGTGYSRTMPHLPHNLYLQQWVNNGVPGVASFIALLLLSYRTFKKRSHRNGQAFVIATALGAAFSHNILDQRPFLMLLGILLGSSAIECREPKHARQAPSLQRI